MWECGGGGGGSGSVCSQKSSFYSTSDFFKESFFPNL